ncbi:TPA: ATP-binding cassette domain-containing protein, partial [Aeromonas hydrophila]|nr:ATP-binding cassette domain-containing protein [Aeromonas hydrophila]
MLSTTPLHLYLEENLLLSLPALKIMPGEVLTLMGPSGCGKSSLLAALAGVLPASGPLRLEGDVTLGERRLTHLPPQARRIGMLFQDDLLFDHLTVAENLMFGMSASV